MPKSNNARKNLRQNISVEKKLYNFLSKNPKSTGEEAYDYLVKHGIEHEKAIEVITSYGTEQDIETPLDKMEKENPKEEEAEEDLSVAGPPAGTQPPANMDDKLKFGESKTDEVIIKGDLIVNGKIKVDEIDSLNTNIGTETKNNQRSIMPKTNKQPKRATEDAPSAINDEGASKGTQADGIHEDGGSGNCSEGTSWDAETENCIPVEGEGAIQPEAPPIVKTQTSVSDGGKSGEARRRAGRERRITGSTNRDLKSERKRTLEYLKKLDRIQAYRSQTIADRRIAAKEKFLKEKRLDQLIRRAKEGARPKASIVPKGSRRVGEAMTTKGKNTVYATEVAGPYAWMKAVTLHKNVPADYLWNIDKQGAFGNAQERFIKKFDANDNVEFVPMTAEQKGTQSATEVLSVTGPPVGDFMRIMSEQVLVLPSGKVVTPIRQFCETKVLPPGTREAFFYDFGTVDFSVITEDGTTQVGASTPVIRSAGGEVAPRGTMLTLGYTQLEEAPIDIIAAGNRSFALESVNDESKEVLITAYGDDTAGSGDATNRKQKGGGVKTIGNGHWVDHAGTQIAADAAGLANLTFAGLVAAKGVIEDEGLDPSNIITYTTGKAIRDLIFDPDLDSFISFSRPAIITEATVERIAGTNVIRSSALKAGAQTGSSQSAMFIPNIAFGLVTGRDLTMEAQRRNELQVIFLTGTQRITGFVKNVEATCRISHL